MKSNYRKSITEKDIDDVINKLSKHKENMVADVWIFGTAEQVHEELKKFDELMKSPAKDTRKKEFADIQKK